LTAGAVNSLLGLDLKTHPLAKLRFKIIIIMMMMKSRYGMKYYYMSEMKC